MPKSESRWSWLETACGFMRSDVARSVTQSSSARTSECSSRSLVSFASTLNTAAKPPAWIGESNGRSFSAGRAQQPTSERFRALVFIVDSL